MSKKKIFLVIAFILAVIILAYLLYIVFFKPAPKEEIVPPEEEGAIPRLPTTQEEWEQMTIKERAEKGLPLYEWKEEIVSPEELITVPAVPSKPEVPPPLLPEEVTPEIDEIAQGRQTWVMSASDEPAEFATLARDGENSLYYNKEEGRFYSVSPYGERTLLTEDVFPNVSNIVWAPTKDKAILEFPDGFKISYNFNTKKQYSLPTNWEEFSWDSTGSKIVFKAMGDYPETRWLAVAQADGNAAKAIEHMGDNANKVIVSWSPNQQVIAFSATGEPRGEFEQEILLIGQYHQNWPALVVDGRGFEPKWSSSGQKLLYSVYSPDSGYRPSLYLVNAQGEEIGTEKIKLDLFTWANKCTFNKDDSYVYCAVPRDLEYGVSLVPEVAGPEIDDFYKINTADGTISFLAEGAMGGYDVSSIYLSADESLLYFTDERTGILKYIKLQ
ncbi:MAG: hypothetical protein BWY03_00312 [Parcubacteria group bacterium ADurb.Bin159]|nr:MAG: hypothetical protein BWY03_00312 [Parcubacteria group bacterium ADurb.Bin159]